MKVSVAPHLYNRREKSNGKYPVKLKIIFNREKKFYSTGIDLSEEEFKILHLDRSLKKLNKQLNDHINKADKIVEDLGVAFSFSKFEKLFLIHPDETPVNSLNVFTALV